MMLRTSFQTQQFMAGNSPAVRIPTAMAFPDKTKVIVRREGNRIIVEPIVETLEDLPKLFKRIGSKHKLERPEFIEAQREW